MTAPAAWLRASAGAASLPTARPVCDVEHADMTEPGVDLDLHHLHRTRHARADREVGEAPHHPAEDDAHQSRLPQRRAMPAAGLLSLGLAGNGKIGRRRRSGRATARSSPAPAAALGASRNRRFQLCTASRVGGIDRRGDAAAARARSFRQTRMADADLDVMRLQRELLRHGVGDARCGCPVPMSCVAQLATRRPPLTASSTDEPGCQK